MDGVKLLTIGEFARQARLSQKALRLYDELGLLRPFRVDEWSGYRYYASSQLERARLVAWLRRLGMPLAQIGAVLDAPPAEAAVLVAAFLRVTEADFAERQRLAQFLISYLREGATAMPDAIYPNSPASPPAGAAGTPLAIRYAAASDTGLIRERNQDVGYAGPRLLAVADGFGPGGERASAATIDAFRRLESEPLTPDAHGAADWRPAWCPPTCSTCCPTRYPPRARRYARSRSPILSWQAAGRRSPRCCFPAPGSRWCTSATRAPTCSATAACSRSPTITR